MMLTLHLATLSTEAQEGDLEHFFTKLQVTKGLLLYSGEAT